jgi:hypothetical protein
MQYWKTHQKELISSYLELILKKKIKFTLWQQHGDHRTVFDAKLIEVSKQLCKLKLNPQSENFGLFRPEHAFFIHVPELDIILKKEKFSTLSEYVEFTIPGSIQVYERRRTRRFSYQYQDHKNITFESITKDPSTGKPDYTFSCVLIDISTSGAGMVVSKEVSAFLEVGTLVHLLNLTDQKLPAPFKVKVMYKNSYANPDSELYKIGLIFDDELDSISYKSISSIVEIKQKKTEGLSKNLYCGLDFEEQVNKLNFIELQNKVLANNLKDNIEYLDKLRYMTTKMKVDFLKSINNDLLAVALRLSSKELIFELFSELTETMQEEFLEKLQNEKPASAICKAQDEILKSIREMESTGEIVLDPTAFITYV